MILITGAAGYIGRALISHFEDLQLDFRPTDKNESKAIVPSKRKIDCLDVTNTDHWLHGTKDIDTIIHLAAESYISRCEQNPNIAILKNLSSIYLLLQAVKQNHVKKIIFPSSFTVYSATSTVISENTDLQPQGLYAYMKFWAEQLLLHAAKNLGVDVIIFRQSNICGNGPISKPTVVQSLTSCWKSGTPMIIHGTGEQTRNFIDIRDCTEAYVKALDFSGSDIFNLGGPTTTSINQIANAINAIGFEHGGYKVPIIHKNLEIQVRDKEPLVTSCNFEKIRNKLGFIPKYSIQDTIFNLIKN